MSALAGATAAPAAPAKPAAVSAASDPGKAPAKPAAAPAAVDARQLAIPGSTPEARRPFTLPKKLTGEPRALSSLRLITGLNPPNRCRGKKFEALMESMAEAGQDTAIKVTLDGRVVGGHRRFAAAQLLNWESIGVSAEDIPEDQIRIVGGRDNFIRDDLTPYEEAEWLFYTKAESPKMTNEAIGLAFGREGSYAGNMIRARAKLCPEILSDWEKGESKVNLAELWNLAADAVAQDPARQRAAYAAGGVKKLEKKEAAEKEAAEEAEAAKGRTVEKLSALSAEAVFREFEALKAEIKSSGKAPTDYQDGVLRCLQWVIKRFEVLLPDAHQPSKPKPEKAKKAPTKKAPTKKVPTKKTPVFKAAVEKSAGAKPDAAPAKV